MIVVFAVCCLLGFAAPPASGERFAGRVVGVADGDTIWVSRGGRKAEVRLHGIDCPERDQPFGREAKRFTSDLLRDKRVTVRVRDHDDYGRTVGNVLVDGRDAGLTLVRAGLAWHYRRYSDDAELATAERGARAAGRGLWSRPEPIPPWEFRRAERRSDRGARAPGRRAAPTASEAGPFRGNTRSRVFHEPGCRNYRCARCTHVFGTQREALQAGYRPAGCCRR